MFFIKPKQEKVNEDLIKKIEDLARDERFQNLLEGVIDFYEKQVRDIIKPMSEVITLSEEDTLEEAIKKIKKWGYSKYPVLSRDGKISGVIHLKHLIGYTDHDLKIGQLLRELLKENESVEPLFVPDVRRCLDLLNDMRERGVSMAIVCDEHEDITGIVTLHDFFEEIVGTILEEHQKDPIRPLGLDGKVYVVEAWIPIDDVEEWLKENTGKEVNLGDSRGTSIGGLFIDKLGRLPSKGESIDINGIRFVADEVEQKRIKTLLMVLQDLGDDAE